MALPVFIELKASIADFTAKMAAVRGELDAVAKKHSNASAVMAKAGGLGLAAIAGAAVAVSVASVKAAGDFQQSMTKLITSGGEAQKNLKSDMGGVMRLMTATGTSASQLADGLYTINSAGFHGAAGLQVLKAAAQGAKTENADLTPVTDGLTTMLNDYGLSAKDAAAVTSKMVEATSLGKTTFQDLAGSLHTVSPAAHTVGLSMNEVLGAMATMTSLGTPAADAATYLRQTILQLSNPTAKARGEMESLGLSFIDVSKNLGERGLTGTLSLLTSAIEKHMGPAGTVLIDKLKSASNNTTKFQQVLANLSPTQQTYVGALADMVGGTKSMQAALELSNSSTMPRFKANVRAVAAASSDAKGNVKGWTDVQNEFNFKLAQAREVVERTAITIGLKLIPVIMSVVDWMGKHKTAVIDGLIGISAAFGVVAAAAIGAYVAENLATLGILAGVTALVAGIVWLATHWHQVWSDIKKWTDDAIKFLRSGFGTLVVLIAGPFAPLLLLALHWQQVWHDIKQWTQDGINAIKGAFNGAVRWLEQAGKDIGGGLWTGIQWPWQHLIKPFFDGIKALFVGFFTRGAGSWLIKGGRDILSGLWAGISFIWTHTVKPFFDAYKTVIVHYFLPAAAWLLRGGRDILSGLWNGIKAVWTSTVVPFWNTIGSKIIRFFATAVTWLFNAGKNIMSGLFHGLAVGIATVSSWLYQHVFTPIMGFFATSITWLMHAGGDIVSGLFHGIAVGLVGVGTWIYNHIFKPIVSAIKAFFGINSPSTVMMGLGANLIDGFLAGLLKVNPLKVVKKVFGSVASFVAKAVSSIGGKIGGVFVGASNSAGGPVAKAGAFASEQALGQQMAAERGWTGAEWASLNALVMGESGWNPTAQNPTSTAYGIAQNIGGPAGYPDASAAGQIDWMLNYIAQRYGDPVNAYNTWLSRSPHWYDSGGILPPGVTLAVNNTGRNEYVSRTPPNGGGVTVNVYGNVYGPGGERELAKRLRIEIERQGRSGTPTFSR